MASIAAGPGVAVVASVLHGEGADLVEGAGRPAVLGLHAQDIAVFQALPV